MTGSPWLEILTHRLLPSSPSRRTPWVVKSGAGCSPACSLTSHTLAPAAPCHGAPKKSLHQALGALAPKARVCQLPAPTCVPLPLLCPPTWMCYMDVVPLLLDGHIGSIRSSPAGPIPPILAHPSIVVRQHMGMGCAVATSSSSSIWGGHKGGRANPKLPLTLPSTDLAWPPALGNAGLAGEAFAPSHPNYRLPWGLWSLA